MINLEDKIGLPVLLGDDNRLTFGDVAMYDPIAIRKFSDLAPVIVDENIELSNDPAYLMYRNVYKISDRGNITQLRLRFDLTVIPPAVIGNEFVKTFGHNHPKK